MAFFADQCFPQMDASNSNEWVDFEQFLDLPSNYDDQSTATTVSPQDLTLSYDFDGSFNSSPELMESSFDMTNFDLSQEFMGMDAGCMQDSAAPLFDDASFLEYTPYDSSNAFRSLVEAQAAADSRVASLKEKRREASIALHLQRLCDATARDLDMSSESNTTFSSPNWSEYISGSISPHPSPHNTSTRSSSEAPPPGGMEMVLDLNMNAATNVPKKQKARSQEQRENYIKARKYGACEKHKKQHKRCNCLEKAAARVAASGVPLNAAIQERSRQLTVQKPILPEVRSSGTPGHDPSFNFPQALPTVKAIREPTGRSGHDPAMGAPSMGLPVGIPTAKAIVKTNTQQSTSSGGIVLLSDDSTAKRAPAHNSAQSGKKSSSAGHDRGLSTRNNTGCGELHNPYSSTAHQPAGSSSVRWRFSTSPSASVVSPNGTDTRPTCSTNHAPLEVLRPRPSSTAGSAGVPGTTASNVGMRSPGLQVSGQNHKRVSDGLAKQLAVLSGLRLVPKDLLDSPTRRGSPDLYAVVKSPRLLVRSAATCVGHLLYNAASALAGAWQSSLALVSGPEDLLFNMLSSSGRKLMLAKKRLHLVGLRTAFFG
ncbi:uncharacterized protein N7515_008335 [Penicillium bovifimosum]|uniref:Uncharacterized protein n=1 Tax=Penicillium bovifimosum TaxID=126998 RepID=A0A9W9KXA3_9EURO|nr:uncharacterized protein N7515_008335 [Penicillium bovifimosum]KAJ5124510.1 hypothetical protein N7515_008335 [Penicillium bovifimosum]